MAAATGFRYINLDESGRAWIDGANTKVIEIAMDRYAYGWSPEEIQFQHPHLSMAQIHAALSYYHEHREKMDSEIAVSHEEYLRTRSASAKSPFVQRLKSEGRLE